MNRVVVISGASSGIGEALAKKYVASGDKVYGLSRTKPEFLDHFFKCDVSSEEEVKIAVHKIMLYEEKIDILVNNSGVGIWGACELLPCDKVRSVMDVNTMGAFYLTKYCLPFMKAGSKIINISSVAGFFTTPFRTVYGMSKAAMNSFSFGLRMELNNSGIQVTAICPGEVRTNFSKNRIKEFDTNERYGDRIKNCALSLDYKDSERMTIDYATNDIFKKVERKKLKAYYIIGRKYRFFDFARKVLPFDLFLNITNKYLGGNKKP